MVGTEWTQQYDADRDEFVWVPKLYIIKSKKEKRDFSNGIHPRFYADRHPRPDNFEKTVGCHKKENEIS